MIEFEPTVMCFIIKDGQILLLKRKNTWFENDKFCPPGGLVEDRESLQDAVVSEVFEETGITVLTDDIELIKDYKSTSNGRYFHNHYFKATKFTGTIENKEPDRHTEVGWFPIDNLPANTSTVVYDTIKELWAT